MAQRQGPGMTRRTALTGAAMAAAAPALAQQAPGKSERVKGPAVWLDLDQAELDDAYDQSVYAPNGRQISARNASNSLFKTWPSVSMPVMFGGGITIENAGFEDSGFATKSRFSSQR
jgi:hypothetical protein